MRKVDVLIIGAGTAGLNAYSQVRKQTDKVLLVNGGPYGTTCARVGCMPSKVLIETAKTFEHAKHLNERGISLSEGSTWKVDNKMVMEYVRMLRDKFVSGVMGYVNHIGDKNLEGYARFVSSNEVEVNGEIIQAERIIIATGSSPVVPEPWKKMQRVITTDEFFEIAELPRRVGVIGMGVIGAELGQAMARLGVEVYGIEMTSRMAGVADDEILAKVKEQFNKEIHLHLETKAELEETDNGIKLKGIPGEPEVDLILASLGRKPNLDNLSLEKAGVDITKIFELRDIYTGRIKGTNLYIAGDVSGHIPILHEAGDDGLIAGRNSVNAQDTAFKRRVPFRVSYTDPMVASVSSDASARDIGDVITGQVDFSAQPRAITMGQGFGLMKVYAHKKDGRILGMEMAGPHADMFGQFFALAIDQGLTVFDLLRQPFYHPTLMEGAQAALDQISRKLGEKEFFALRE